MSIFELATDGGGSTQQQVFREKISTLNSVHGCALLNRLFPLFIGGGGACAEGMFLPRIFVAEKGFASVSFTQFS